MFKWIVTAILISLPSLAMSQTVIFSEADTVYLIEARTTLRYELGDNDSTNATWSNTILDNFINSSMRDVASLGAIIKLDTVVTAANQLKYALNTDAIRVLPGVLRKDNASGRWKAIEFRALRKMDASDVPFGRDNKPTGPYYYYSIDKNFFVDKVGSGGDSLMIFYESYANNVLDTTNTGAPNVDSIIINVPYQFQGLVIKGAKSMALLSNREDQTNVIVGQAIQQEYALRLQELARRSDPLLLPGAK